MKSHNFELVGGDTDGLAFKKPDHAPFTLDERKALLVELNTLTDGLITWEDDGMFPVQLVVKTKNYVLIDEVGKRKVKGSALKATMKEKALKRFLQEVIAFLLTDKQDQIMDLYLKYAAEIIRIKDISDWCSKHTITKAVLSGKKTTQIRIREALKGRPVQEGDKIYQFVKSDSVRCMLEDFDGTYCVDTLLRKLYLTLKVFKTILDIDSFPNLTLKKNKKILEGLKNADL
jgi:hypothetical protein